MSCVARVTRASMLAYMVNATIALGAIWSYARLELIVAWALLAFAVPGLILARSFKPRHRTADINVEHGIHRAIVYGVLLGLPWGLIDYVSGDGLPLGNEIIIITLVVGMSASGCVLLSPVAPAALAYMLAVLCPHLLGTLLTGTNNSWVMALLIVPYGFFLSSVIGSLARLSAERNEVVGKLKTAEAEVRLLNLELEEQANARTRRLAHQQAVISTLMTSAEVRDCDAQMTIRTLTRTLAKEIGVDRCGFWLLDKTGSRFECCEVYETARDSFDQPPSWDTPHRVQTMLRTSSRKIIAIDDLRTPNQLSEIARYAFLPLGILSTLQAPILSRDGHIGFITCSNVKRTFEWTQDHKLFVAGIANLAAMVLEHSAKLELQASSASRAQKLARQQEALNTLMQQQATGSDLDSLLSDIAKVLRTELKVDRVGVRLFNQEGNSCLLSQLFDPEQQRMVSSPSIINDNIYPKVLIEALAKAPIAVDDCENDPRFASAYGNVMKTLNVRATLHAPILIAGKIEGCIGCSVVGETRAWGAEDTLLATGVANIIALALERRRRQEIEQQLREANDVKGRFLANMSHEVRTPLNGVLAMADLMTRTDLDQHQRKLLATISQSSNQLLAVVNDILDINRIKSGKLSLDHHEFELADCAGQVLEILSSDARRKGLQLELEVAKDAARKVKGDSDRIRQILLNLIGNSIKFTAEGLVKLSIETGKDDGHACNMVRFQVRDTGSGIEPELLCKIMKPFAQADTSMSRRHGGTGLGLSIARHLVEMMGGEMSIASMPEYGTTVSFTVPLELLGAKPRQSPATKPITKTAGAGAAAAATRAVKGELEPSWGQQLDLKILVAEDNPVNQVVAEQYLLNLGCTVTLAENGLHALEALAREAFDVVLMDCQMPEMDGLTATRRIRADEKASGRAPIPIIAVTAHAFEEDRNDCIEAGMNGFVSKPYTQNEMAMALQQWGPRVASRLRPPAEASHAAAAGYGSSVGPHDESHRVAGSRCA